MFLLSGSELYAIFTFFLWVLTINEKSHSELDWKLPEFELNPASISIGIIFANIMCIEDQITA